MVTVEAAVAIGSLVAVLALVLAAMGAMLLQLRCADAAAEAARLGSRGDVDGARRAAARLVPDGAVIAVDVRGDDVTVGVEAAPLGTALPGIRVRARAVASREPDVVASGEPGPDTAPEPADPELTSTEPASPQPASPDPAGPLTAEPVTTDPGRPP